MYSCIYIQKLFKRKLELNSDDGDGNMGVSAWTLLLFVLATRIARFWQYLGRTKLREKEALYIITAY